MVATEERFGTLVDRKKVPVDIEVWKNSARNIVKLIFSKRYDKAWQAKLNIIYGDLMVVIRQYDREINK